MKTQVVHSGEPRHFPFESLTTPIVQTATYTFRNSQEVIAFMEGKLEREEYGRYGNPSVSVLEKKLAELEGTEDALTCASGMTAVTMSILALVKQGSHVVLFADCYRRTRQFVMQFLSRFGVEHSLVPAGDLEALERAIRPETRLVISEAPTNPYQSVVDLERLAEICRKRGVKSLVDSTFATPVNMQPARYGIDIVIHSATKYLAGHNDVLGGVVAANRGLTSLVRDFRHVFGAMLDPHAAYLIQRGMKTLALRVAQQNESAQVLAEALEGMPGVKQVWYPGLPSHPDHALAKRYMSGFGGVVTFELERDLEGTMQFIDACKIPRIAPSLGGVESLIEQPSLMSYFELSTEQREAVGIRDGVVRYAVGIEDAADLVDDLRQALESTQAA